MKKILVSVLLYLSLTSLIYAADLMDVYRQALENDPAFKAAYSTYMSTREAIPQARASLLPQMSVRSQLSLNTQNVNAGSSLIISEAYRNSQWELSASQAIFNYKAWWNIYEKSFLTNFTRKFSKEIFFFPLPLFNSIFYKKGIGF